MNTLFQKNFQCMKEAPVKRSDSDIVPDLDMIIPAESSLTSLKVIPSFFLFHGILQPFQQFKISAIILRLSLANFQI